MGLKITARIGRIALIITLNAEKNSPICQIEMTKYTKVIEADKESPVYFCRYFFQ
jgi:hypothetical protein